MNLVLGSQSPPRRKLLKEMGYEFTTAVADIDEKSIRNKDPERLTLALAHAKADKIIEDLDNDSVLITVDTVLEVEKEILEKAEDQKEAQRFIELYSSFPTKVVTGIVAVNTKTNQRSEGTHVAIVDFERIPEKVIKELLEEGAVLNCAGCLMIEHPIIKKYIKRIRGETASIMGLPNKLTRDLLGEVGYSCYK